MYADQAQARDDRQVVDPRDHSLPFFAEATSNLWMPVQKPKAIRWRRPIDEFDGFI